MEFIYDTISLYSRCKRENEMNSIWPLIGITAAAGVGGTGLGGVIACLFKKDSDNSQPSAFFCSGSHDGGSVL